MYYAVRSREGPEEYGHKDKTGIYITDRIVDATGYQERHGAEVLAEEINDLFGHREFEAKKKALDAETSKAGVG